MEPILILCLTPEDYSKWTYYLQKVDYLYQLCMCCILFAKTLKPNKAFSLVLDIVFRHWNLLQVFDAVCAPM